MKLLQRREVQIVLALIVGAAIGAIFYPSKTITEEERQRYERQIEREREERLSVTKNLNEKLDIERSQSLERTEELSQKIDVKSQEITKLKAKITEKTYKIVKPDGTIEERTFKESDIQRDSQVVTSIRSEFDRKVKSIESRYVKIHQNRVSEIKQEYESKLKEKEKVIASLDKKKVTEINKRSFGISAGYMSDSQYFGSVSYDIFGPVFIQGIFETNRQFGDSSVGIGFGLRF